MNVGSTKVLIEDTIFTSPAGDGTPLYVVIRPSHAKISPLAAVQREYLLNYFKALSIGSAPGIEPATFRPAVKRSTDGANPAAGKVFSPERSLNQPKATFVCIRWINQSNRPISVRVLFLLCSRVFISRSYETKN